MNFRIETSLEIYEKVLLNETLMVQTYNQLYVAFYGLTITIQV